MQGLVVAALVLGGLVGGCSSHDTSATTDDGGGADASDDSDIGCEGAGADTYVAGMSKLGKNGQLTFVLLSSDPGPPVRGSDSWIVEVLAANGQPAAGATITMVTPFMPQHGHGTSIAPQVTPQSDGRFQIAPLYFFMPGLWQVTIEAQAGATTDSGVFSFCVPG
jgi:hypothetical protein